MNAEKELVRQHWEREPCGTRYVQGDGPEYFEELSRTRYKLEPDIFSFADFPSAKDKEVLEIGVGAGADFQNWCEHAKHATGVDLTEAAIRLTGERLKLRGIPQDRYTLIQTDAEQLPFEEDSFDIVYAYGVLHHSPSLENAISEAFRVLRPGGRFLCMIYHVPSVAGFLLYVRHGLLKGRPFVSQKEIMFHHLESPGTRCCSKKEASELLSQAGFSEVSVSVSFGTGDLLTMKLSDRYSAPIYRMIQRLFPRWLVRTCFRNYGSALFLKASKGNMNNKMG